MFDHWLNDKLNSLSQNPSEGLWESIAQNLPPSNQTESVQESNTNLLPLESFIGEKLTSLEVQPDEMSWEKISTSLDKFQPNVESIDVQSSTPQKEFSSNQMDNWLKSKVEHQRIQPNENSWFYIKNGLQNSNTWWERNRLYFGIAAVFTLFGLLIGTKGDLNSLVRDKTIPNHSISMEKVTTFEPNNLNQNLGNEYNSIIQPKVFSNQLTWNDILIQSMKGNTSFNSSFSFEKSISQFGNESLTLKLLNQNSTLINFDSDDKISTPSLVDDSKSLFKSKIIAVVKPKNFVSKGLSTNNRLQTTNNTKQNIPKDIIENRTILQEGTVAIPYMDLATVPTYPAIYFNEDINATNKRITTLYKDDSFKEEFLQRDMAKKLTKKLIINTLSKTYVGLNGSYGNSYIKENIATSSQVNDQYQAQLKMPVAKNLQLGLNVGFQLSKRLEVISGVNYSSFNELINKEISITKVPLFDIDQKTILGYIDLANPRIEKVQGVQKRTDLRLPLVLKFNQPIFKGFSLTISTGMIFASRISSSGIGINYGTLSTQPNQFSALQSGTNWIGHLGAGFEFQISKRFSLQLEPNFQGDLKSSFNKSNPVDRKTQNLNLNLGIKWFPFKK